MLRLISNKFALEFNSQKDQLRTFTPKIQITGNQPVSWAHTGSEKTTQCL